LGGRHRTRPTSIDPHRPWQRRRNPMALGRL
jgi:hypothetical protein